MTLDLLVAKKQSNNSCKLQFSNIKYERKTGESN